MLTKQKLLAVNRAAGDLQHTLDRLMRIEGRAWHEGTETALGMIERRMNTLRIALVGANGDIDMRQIKQGE